MYKRFEDLKVWQLAREFRKEIYRLTKKFPKAQSGLVSRVTTQKQKLGCS